MSTIKTWLYDFIIGSMVFYITTQVMSGISTSGYIVHWLMVFGVFFLGTILVPQLLKFLTLPRTFFTFWLVGSLINFAAIYAMSLFVPGITIGETLIDPVSLGIISVNPYTLGPEITMVAAGIFAGAISALLFWLNKE